MVRVSRSKSIGASYEWMAQAVDLRLGLVGARRYNPRVEKSTDTTTLNNLILSFSSTSSVV